MMKFFCWIGFGLCFVQFLGVDLAWAGKEKTSGRILKRPCASDFQDPAEFEKAFQEWRAYRNLANERARKYFEKKKLEQHVPKKRVRVKKSECVEPVDGYPVITKDRVFRSKRLAEKQKRRAAALAVPVASEAEAEEVQSDLAVGMEQDCLRLPEIRDFLDFNPEDWFDSDPALLDDIHAQFGAMLEEQDQGREDQSGEPSGAQAVASSSLGEVVQDPLFHGRSLESLEELLECSDDEELPQTNSTASLLREMGLEDSGISGWFSTPPHGVSETTLPRKEVMSQPTAESASNPPGATCLNYLFWAHRSASRVSSEKVVIPSTHEEEDHDEDQGSEVLTHLDF